MVDTPPADAASIRDLAAEHGLDVDESSIIVNDAGLDFRVAIARTTDGRTWVVRMPRRQDVLERAAVEERLLRAVAPHLSAHVPDWRIVSEQLIAYPLLPGKPGLALDDSGSPVWAYDIASSTYATSLGDLLSELHSIDASEVRATGIEVRTPSDVREKWRADIDTVSAEFEIAQSLSSRWHAWLADDTFWPDWSVLTHGEIYPAHTLLEGERITGVLDWTTAEVGDPARDFMVQQAFAPPETFDLTVRRYIENGGRVWPRLADHCAEMFATSPLGYGLFALMTGEHEHRNTAEALLNPASQ
ncbi:macrolide 2'-phosphotransferase [Paramicrobacterium chengjingii]|uniref:Macrolide 2'-phosphotransferase n=1 Tax=Paramicrobacterium chengjingii TaxID=2769067 RepID=A0ABX6YLC4_9MICO|nr:macrolide 2'-phosphotransferase [Microbacterium chengjingii]QPZ39592.1 macrolide 2'-phosphotransferase [Microbacterium chengjingii]